MIPRLILTAAVSVLPELLARRRDAGRVRELEACLRECADELEAEVQDRYSQFTGRLDNLSARNALRLKEDLEPVRRAREVLGDG